MANPAGELDRGELRIDLDRRLNPGFTDSKIIPDSGLLPFQELRDVLELTEVDLISEKWSGTSERVWRILILMRGGWNEPRARCP